MTKNRAEPKTAIVFDIVCPYYPTAETTNSQSTRERARHRAGRNRKEEGRAQPLINKSSRPDKKVFLPLSGQFCLISQYPGTLALIPCYAGDFQGIVAHAAS